MAVGAWLAVLVALFVEDCFRKYQSGYTGLDNRLFKKSAHPYRVFFTHVASCRSCQSNKRHVSWRDSPGIYSSALF
ncbi:hypothetical protein LX36DRAFT_48721 [Colletotrichum falcatum]|nr:hypothetical protein LX36DRAFT_48721 [Colletotrichum falcatum]